MNEQPQANQLRVRPVKKSLPEKSPPKLDPQVEDSNLTPRQRAFVEYYMTGDNAKNAALKAGYSESVAAASCSGTNLLYNSSVQAEIRRRTKAKFASVDFTAERMLEIAMTKAQTNIMDFIEIDEAGRWRPDLKKIDRDMGVCIKELSYDLQGKPKLIVHDSKPWWDSLAKHYGICRDKTEVTGLNGGPIQMTVEFLDKALKSVTNNVQININESPEKHNFPETVEQLQLSE